MPNPNTGFMIRFVTFFTLALIVLAGFGVARFFDLVVQGWPALAAILGIMVGGKTMERVKELGVGTTTTTATIATSSPAPKEEPS